MTPQEKLQDDMDKLLRGELSPKAQQELLKNEEAKADLAWMQDLQKTIRVEGRQHLKAELQDLEKKNAKSARMFSLTRLFAAAAAVAILCVGLWWMFASSPDNDALFASYFQPFPNVVAPITKGENASDQIAVAYQQYELGNHEQAAVLLAKLPQDGTTYFYRGVNELSLNQPENALFLLKKADPKFEEASIYYQALAHLKLQENESAISLLNKLTDKPTTPLGKKAMQLLTELD